MSETREIYLDESGRFEKSLVKSLEGQGDERPAKPIKVIGGLMVPPVLKEREQSIRKRLIDIRNIFFPQKKREVRVTDIHVSDQSLTPQQRQNLRQAMLEVLKQEMPEAQIVFIYDLEELTEERPPGAQLFRNMLTSLLGGLIFYHPVFSDDAQFQVHLAHRRFHYPLSYDLKLADQGYLKLKDEYGLTWYTAITTAELLSSLVQKRQALRFMSKRKEPSCEIRPYDEWDSPFMAMADTVCNTIFHCLRRARNFNPEEVYESVLEKFVKDQVFYFCPSNYDFPANILETFYENRPGEFIASYVKRGAGNRCDSLLLGPALNQAVLRLEKGGDFKESENILRLADEFLEGRHFHDLPTVKALIMVVAKCLGTRAAGDLDPAWKKVAYLYHTVALRYHNHQGNVRQSHEHRDHGQQVFQVMEKRDLQQLRDHHGFLNAASVADTNEFAFHRAIDRLRPIMEAEENLLNCLGPSANDIKNETLGKIYGSLAQNHAFAKQYDEARSFFEKAARHLGRENFMQISFRAHLSLDQRNQKQYETEMALLFKCGSFPGYADLVSRCLKNLPRAAFNLHLLLKGMIVFPESAGDRGKILEQICSRVNYYLDPRRSRGQHPWELVFITLGRLLWDYLKDGGQAREYLQTAARFTSDPDNLTLIMLGHSARAWEGLYWLEILQEETARSLLAPLVQTFQNLQAHSYTLGIFNPNRLKDQDGVFRPGWFDDTGHKLLEVKGLATLGRDAFRELLSGFLEHFTFNYW